MLIKNCNKNFVFTGNPVRVSLDDFPAGTFDKRGATFCVKADYSDIFRGRFFPPCELDLSEVLDAHVPYFDEPVEGRIISVCGEPMQVSLTCDFAGLETDAISFMAIRGGVSAPTLKRLNSSGEDVFSRRFLFPQCNYFLTTRSDSWRLGIKETEIFPLYFLLDKECAEIKLVAPGKNAEIAAGPFMPGAYTLDLNEARWNFMINHNYLPSIIDVYTEGRFSCRIVISEAQPLMASQQRALVKFRNSFGVFEVLDVTGQIKTSLEAGEEETWNRYNHTTGIYEKMRARAEISQSVMVEMTVDTPEQLRMLAEMVASEETYLLDTPNKPTRVIATLDEASYERVRSNGEPRMDSPITVGVKLEAAEAGHFIMEDIIAGERNRRARVFTDEFAEQFD